MKKKKENHKPDWLDSVNDDKIRKKNAPLFGTGDLPVDEKASSKEQQQTKEEKQEEGRVVVDYGSTALAAKTKGKTDNEKEPLLAAATAGDSVVFPAVSSKTAEEAKPHVPIQNPCLYLFHLLEGFAVATALCLLATQVIPLFFVKGSSLMHQFGLSLVLKVYISLFCVLFIITELNLPIPLIRSSPLLQAYLSRGFLYSFLGLICVEEAYSERIKDIISHGNEEFHVGWVAIFMQITSWLMLGIGVLYMLLGLCCLKRVRDRMKEREIEAWREYREALRQWRAEYGE